MKADWTALAEEMNAYGCALTPPVLSPADCKEIARCTVRPSRFRSTVDMERYRFGRGQYRYFREPFPRWWRSCGRVLPAPAAHRPRLGRPAGPARALAGHFDEWLDMCHEAGQTKPTPILLRYQEGDWNALHRDLYGDLVFPLQVVIGLDEPGEDYTGGEFLLVEQRPRAQSRGTVTLLPQGHGLIFTTRDRPVRSSRGWSAVAGAARGQHRPLGSAAHAGPRLPRRRMTHTLIGADAQRPTGPPRAYQNNGATTPSFRFSPTVSRSAADLGPVEIMGVAADDPGELATGGRQVDRFGARSVPRAGSGPPGPNKSKWPAPAAATARRAGQPGRQDPRPMPRPGP